LAFAVAAVCFFAATAYTDFRVRELGDMSLAASHNALPDVVHLSRIRVELRHLGRALDAGERAQIDALLERIDENTRAYLYTGMFPDEDELWSVAQRELASIKATVSQPGAAVENAEKVLSAIDAADSQLDKLVTLNATNGELAARRFEKLESTVTETAY